MLWSPSSCRTLRDEGGRRWGSPSPGSACRVGPGSGEQAHHVAPQATARQGLAHLPHQHLPEGQTHFIFSARCSVFSRMACDSWDTGFSIRLSKITWEDPGISMAQQCPGGPAHSLHPDSRSRPREHGGGAGGDLHLLAAPRPRLVGQGTLSVVVHVLVEVPRVHGARWHLLEVEAGLWDALHQLQRGRAGSIGTPGGGRPPKGGRSGPSATTGREHEGLCPPSAPGACSLGRGQLSFRCVGLPRPWPLGGVDGRGSAQRV